MGTSLARIKVCSEYLRAAIVALEREGVKKRGKLKNAEGPA